MKTTLEKLMMSREALSQLIDTPLRASVAFKVKRVIEQTNAELEPAQAQILEAREKYGPADEQMKPEDIEKLQEEVNELLEYEVKLASDTIHINELGDVEIKPALLMALDWLIVE